MGWLTTSFLLVAAASSSPPSVDELARLTPPDAQVVVAADVAALRAHPAVQGWLATHSAPWAKRGEEGEALLREAGLDPRRDVDALVFAAAHRPQGNHAWLTLFGGSFDPASLAAFLTKRGAVVVPGVPFLLLRALEEKGEAPLIAVLDRLIAVGDEDSVRAAATRSTLGAGVVRVERAAGRLDTRATFWMALDLTAALRQDTQFSAAAPESMRGLLQASRAVERLLFHARLGDALELEGWAQADGPENAELLHDAVKGLLAALRLRAQERRPELVDVLRQARVTQRHAQVTALVTVPVALLESMAASAQSTCNPAGSP